MRVEREAVARSYTRDLAGVEEIELPLHDPDRMHSWHLYPLRLRLDRLSIGRDGFLDELKKRGVGCSVHWRPLHLHPYYQESFGWDPRDFPAATEAWQRLISLPIFPGMRDEEIAHVVDTVKQLCRENRTAAPRAAAASP
jgi:perosamine synthetase